MSNKAIVCCLLFVVQTRWWKIQDSFVSVLYQSFVPHHSHSDQPHLVLHATTTTTTSPNHRIYLHTHCLGSTQPTNRPNPTEPRNPKSRQTCYLTTLDDSDQMPGLHWPFVLAPLPPRRKKRVQPGFTDEELLYLEEILALVCPYVPSFPFTHTPVNINHPLD